MQYVIILLSSLLIFISSVAYGAPAVTGVTGTVSHSSSVSISGSGFGTKSPAAPVMWDPIDGQSAYSGLSNGDTVPVGGSNPWPRASTDGPVYYKTTNPRGKWTAKYSNQWAGTGPGVVGGKDFSTQCAGGKLYLTWWYYSTGTSDDLAGDGESNKFNRLTNNGNADNTPSQLNLMPDHSIGYDINIGYVFNTWYGWSGTRSAWNRVDEVIDNSTTPHPNVKIYVNNSLLANSTASQSLPVDICGISSLGFDVSNDPTATVMDFGEIYVDNTLARVEICAGSTWASRGHCEIQIPSAWSTSSATVTVNQGSFADGSSQYLYVVDSAGSANSSGYSVTFGAGSVVNGACGSNKTGSFGSLTSGDANNCSSGTVSSFLSGQSPHNWTWSCAGSGGGTTDTSCYADIDTTAPTTTISTSSPQSISTDSLTVTGTASDTGGAGLSGVKFRVGAAPDATHGTMCTGTSTWSCATYGYASGTNTLYVSAYDAAGNYTSSVPTITVNYSASSLIDMIVDNSTSEKTTFTGAWSSSVYYSGYYGVDYMFSNSSVNDTYTWTETNLSAGVYNVYARWTTGGEGRPEAAQYDITHAGGTATVYKNQNNNGGDWQLLGTYTFGTTGSVKLYGCDGCWDGTSADAVRFLQISASGSSRGIRLTGGLRVQ